VLATSAGSVDIARTESPDSDDTADDDTGDVGAVRCPDKSLASQPTTAKTTRPTKAIVIRRRELTQIPYEPAHARQHLVDHRRDCA